MELNNYRHINIKLTNCDPSLLRDKKNLSLYTREVCKELKYGKIKSSFFIFNPNGLTFVVLFKDGQLTLITDYSKNTAFIDLFTNSSNIKLSPFKYLKKILKAENLEIYQVNCENDEPNTQEVISNLESNLTIRDKFNDNLIISILGSCGGVATSLLSILNKACSDKSDPLYNFINSSKFHLIDLNQKDNKYYTKNFPNLLNKLTFHKFDLNDVDALTTHLKDSKTSIVLDISFADTVDTLRCCDSLGIIYINSALESISVDKNEDLEGFPLQERFEIFESHKDEFKNTTAIICSGMNPGVVQWMAIELMKKYPNEMPLGCYIVEEDTSFFYDERLADKETLYTTWSTECFLDEAIYSYPNFIKNHQSLFLYKEVYELEFKVRLGKREFFGCLMPHEEALTLGKMYDMETGFIYKINNHTTNIIRDNLDNLDSLWERPMEVLDPKKYPLTGTDSVGILLVFSDKEAYMYNALDNKKAYKKYNTNATYIQVASGLYGALATILLDNIPKGIYYVDELLVNTDSKYGEYLTHHLESFVTGENIGSDGDLIKRMRQIKY